MRFSIDDDFYISSDQLIEVMAYLRRPDESCEYAQRVADAYEKIFPAVHPTLGMFFMRVSNTISRNTAIVVRRFLQFCSCKKRVLVLLVVGKKHMLCKMYNDVN